MIIVTNAMLDFIVASNSQVLVCEEGTTWMLYPDYVCMYVDVMILFFYFLFFLFFLLYDS